MSDRHALLVIGGGPAGFAAARGYRAAGGAGRVAIVADEGRMPYRRPPLTKELLRGEAGEADLPLEDERWLAAQRVELIAGRAVTLDPGARVVGLSGGRELPYEACLLATGAEPTRLPVPGADQPAVRVIRSLDHVRDLHARLAGRRDSVAVIGSGFIGCEIAASLRLRGHPVSLLSDEAAPNAARLGEAAGKIIGEWLAGEGVELHLGCPVERIDATADGVRVKAGQTSVAARVAVMAAGVTPRAELAAQAGLELVDGGAIAVDTAMRATGDGLLAAGDVCRAENRAAGRALRVEHWGDALAQGEVAGRSVAGADAAWDAVPGFWSTIGRRTLKYAAWGDGYDESRLETGPGGSFVVRYGRGGALVGVLTHESDDAYEAGAEQIAAGARWT